MTRHPGNLPAARLTLIALLVLAAVPVARAQQRLEPPLRLTAFAVNLGVTPDARPLGQSGTVIINIDRWSNPAERAALLQTFRDKGPDGLRAALLETKQVGNIRTPDSIGWPLHYAHMVPGEDGGTHIFLATERRIAFWEAASNARTLDYPFTLVEIRIGPDGEGEGRLSLATKVTLSQDGNNLRLENYASEPVRLQSVRLDK
jgi:hypothetical protein